MCTVLIGAVLNIFLMRCFNNVFHRVGRGYRNGDRPGRIQRLGPAVFVQRQEHFEDPKKVSEKSVKAVLLPRNLF